MAWGAVSQTDRVILNTIADPSPTPLRRAALAGAAAGRLALLQALEGLRGEAHLWQGADRASGQTLRAAYIGDQRAWKTGSEAYLQTLLYDPNSVVIASLGRLAMSAAPRLARDLAAQADIIFIERSRRSQWTPITGEWRLTPTWVRMGVRFQPDEDWEAVEARMHGHKNNIRRFRKYGFALSTSRSMEDFELFYERMHAPMIAQRHGEYAELESKASMRKTFAKNGLILFAATPEGEIVAGKLLYHYGRLAYVYASGTLDGDPRWHYLGALSALSWYEIRWAYENEIATLDCGSVRPFASDGNYLYKLRWGIQPIPDPWAARDWLIWVPNANPAALDWLERHPLIPAL
jgi:hypothetical protein